jgi:hypothetical protein
LKDLDKKYRFLVGVLLMPFIAMAQLGSAEAEINLNLQQILSLEIGTTNVTIPMYLPAHFENGNATAPLNNHIQVNATSAYTIKVRAEQDTFTVDGAPSTVPINTIQLSVSANAGTGITVLTPSNMSDSDVQIINSNANQIQQSFNAIYAIPQNKANEFLGKPGGNYTTTLIYTIVPQ